MLRRLLAGLVLCGSVVAGCGPTKTPSGPPPNDTPATDAIESKDYRGLAACKGSTANTEIDRNLEISAGFKQSCHEMVVCGGLNASMATAIIGVLIDAATGEPGDPKGFTFDGKGTWLSKQMDVQFFLGEDASFGKAGDLITFNPFVLSTYFTEAKVVAKSSINTSGETTASISVEFNGLGPGVELLGLGPNPQNPIMVDGNKIAEALGKIRIASKIHIDDQQANSTFRYELSTDPAPLSQVSEGEQAMKLLSITGTQASLNQSLSIRDFKIDYRQIGDGYLDGSIGFDIKGGAFDYQVLFSYPHRTDPDVILGCPGDTLAPLPEK